MKFQFFFTGLLFSILFPILSKANTDTTNVSFIAYWAVNDVYKYEIKKYIQQWSGEDLVKFDSSSYIAEFRVIDSTETSYKVKWTYKNEIFRSLQLSEEITNSLKIDPVLEVIYTTDEYGEYTGIENWEDIRKSINQLYDILIPFLTQSGENSGGIEKILNQMKNTFQTKVGIEAFLVPELKVLHFPFGSSLDINKEYEYEDSYPNMFGIDPVKANGKLYLSEVDFEDEYCILIQEVSLDEDSSKSMILDFFKLSEFKKDDFDKILQDSNVEINDYNVYGVYYYPGVIEFIRTVRETVFISGDEEVSRRDQLIINLLFEEEN